MILERNHHEAICPFGGLCDEDCAVLQTDCEGMFVCGISLIPISDTYGPQMMYEGWLSEENDNGQSTV